MITVNIDFGNDGFSVESELKRDGDKWCVMVGDDLQAGVAGFGDQILDAIADFKSNFRNS